MGPNNPDLILEGTNDIASISGGRETTSGSLYWNEGEAGQKTFTLNIKPYIRWEIQMLFKVIIYQINGYPKDVGDGEISRTHGSVSLIVSMLTYLILYTNNTNSKRQCQNPN